MAGQGFYRAWSPPNVESPSPSKTTTKAAVDLAAKPFTGSVKNLRAAMVAEAHGGSNELLTVAPGSLAVGAEIGQGRFKRVHRGWHRRFGAVVLLQFTEGRDANELSILKHFADEGGFPNIPKVLEIAGDRVIQEYALWGSVKGALQEEHVRARVSPAHRRCIAAQIARAGAFLTDSRIVHADLSCRNILLFWLEEEPKFSVAKVTDFGLAVRLPEGRDFVTKQQPQATRWCSPETVAHLTLSHRSDVWGLGATLWELFSNGSAPWSGRSKRKDVAARLRDLSENNGAAEGGPDVAADFPLSKNVCGTTVHNIMLSCLRADEHARPSFMDLRQSFEQISQVAEAPENVSISESEEEDCQENMPDNSRKASTVSTTDSLHFVQSASDTLHMFSAMTDNVSGTARLQKIKDFLITPPALLTLGKEAVQEMLSALDEARAQKTLLGDDSNPNSTNVEHAHECVHERSQPKSRSDDLVSNQRSGSERCSFPEPPQVIVQNPGNPEHVVALVQSTGKWVETKPLPPPDRDAWTLTTYIQPALRRQDFASAEEAWAAFSADKERPCVLRGPHGVEAATSKWVPSPLARGYPHR